MIRVLFSVLAVVVAVLAIVLKQPLLYVIAAALLLVAVGVWMKVLRQRHRETVQPYTPSTKAPPLPEEDLKSLGILDIRPKESSPLSNSDDSNRSEASYAPAATPDPASSPDDLKEFVIPPNQGEATSDRTAESPPSTDSQAKAAATLSPHQAMVLVPYLQALHAALGAHTVCLLKQEDITPDYEVVMLIDAERRAQSGQAFSTMKPLLTAGAARQAVTVQPVGARGIPRSSLGYTFAPNTIREVALASVPRPADPAAYFLLADSEDLRLSRARSRTLLAQFAQLLGTLLTTTSGPVKKEASALTPEPASSLAQEAPSAMRPRREIIAEEMAQARAREQSLALALVYLNQAETIAAEGEAAIVEAEQELATCLQQIAQPGRVERFGELTYGVFYDGTSPNVDAWGAGVQQAMAEESGWLEGGVSIGIALLQDRHKGPNDLRADATEALREAYQTGACTILE